ncbi:putative permease [Synechococcus sp. PCC 7502]|uniref:AI-2E family transporter n=1 Tax=Synechococcus sp. PCC 7502 TaxID=1173263 RepID=UPI00029F8B33|nr:AI-2E family transporter [Synechococcus sp. PCC 7502]AFY72359.1 putative permease [Synechococcus sp. PCC 7502]
MVSKEEVWKYLQRGAIALLGIYLVWRLKQTIQLLLVSLFFASAITPLLEQMEKYKIRRGLGVVVIYSALLLIILLTIAPAPQLIVELGQFLTQVPNLVSQINVTNIPFLNVNAQQIQEFLRSSTVLDQIQNLGREIANQTVGFTFGLINTLGIILLTMLITGYMVINSKELTRRVLRPFSEKVRSEVYVLMPPINRCLGAYVLGRIGTSALLGFCTYLALIFVGVEFAGGLSLLVAVANLIPFVGPILGLIPMVIAAWSLGLVKVGLVIGISFLLQQIEAWILQPWLVGPYLNLDPFELLLSIIVGAELLGVVGALIAPPLAGVGRIIFDHFERKRKIETEDNSYGFPQFDTQRFDKEQLDGQKYDDQRFDD